jgi:hypothetical protein
MEGEARRESMTSPTAISRRKFLVEGAAAFAVASQVLGKPGLRPPLPRLVSYVLGSRIA